MPTNPEWGDPSDMDAYAREQMESPTLDGKPYMEAGPFSVMNPMTCRHGRVTSCPYCGDPEAERLGRERGW